MDFKQYIREVKGFPKDWINFKDITTLLSEPEVYKELIDTISKKIEDVDVIVWLDARWFLFAWALSYKLNKPLVIVRKKWKLPYKTISVDYELEYWSNTFDIHIDSIKKDQKVAIIDDLLATGWTAYAACQLVEKLWWIIHSLNFIIELKELNWKNKLNNYVINTICDY